MLILVCLIAFSHILLVKAKPHQCEDLSYHHRYHLLNPDICGRSLDNSSTSNRIVWGNGTYIGEHPWMAIVAITKELDNGLARRECDGTLITNQYVLTAGSCFDAEGVNTKVKVWLRVYQERHLGIINCDGQRCSPPPIMIEADSFTVHPDEHYDNIALVRLKDKAEFDDFLKPVCLPLSCDFRSFDFVGTMGTMLGWDNIGVERTGLEASALEKSLMMIISRQSCQEQWEDDLEIRKSQICGSWPGGRAACRKDIGGPLLTETHPNGVQMYQLGIITQGLCGDGYRLIGRPTVFTRVGDYIPFILDNIY